MPLPTDRLSLVRLAAETQRVIDGTANAEDEKSMRQHAASLRKLGTIRWKLGELREAGRLLSDSSAAYLRLGSPSDLESAAVARIQQSAIAMVDDRSDEALEIIERLVERFGGFPALGRFPAMRAAGLETWLVLLEEREDYERLYEAAETALALLDPVDPNTDRFVMGKALARRAKSAEALGSEDEALRLYESAIAVFDADDIKVTGRYLGKALRSLVALLVRLDREDEAADILDPVIARFLTRTEPWAQQAIAETRALLAADSE